MNVSKDDAKDSLSQIQTIAAQTRKKIASSSKSGLLIMWGLLWITAFIGTHFFLTWVWLIWFGLCGLGCICTFLVCWRQLHVGIPTKSPDHRKIGWRIFWFWTLLFIYIFIWLSILRPRHGIQLNAFMCTTIIFAWAVMGLWDGSWFMVWLGLAVTAFTIIGFYLIAPHYYCLWMAPTGGGTILGTGLYIRFCWK